MPTADAFKTRKGDPAVEITGVGLVDDTHDVPLDRAARSMSELQDEHGEPLTGSELVDAAKEWADRVGLQVGKTKLADPDEPAAPAAPEAESTDAPASAPDHKE